MTNSLWQRPMKDMLWHILVTHICVMEVWDGNSVTENAWHILCDENLETDILWRTMVTDVVWWICCDRLCDEYVVMDYDNGCDRLNTYYDMTDYWCLKILWQNSSQSLWILDKIFVKGFFFFFEWWMCPWHMMWRTNKSVTISWISDKCFSHGRVPSPRHLKNVLVIDFLQYIDENVRHKSQFFW